MFAVLALFYGLIHLFAFVYFYRRFWRVYRLWTSQDVPQLPATFPMGNLTLNTMLQNFGDVMQQVYAQFKSLDPDSDYGGLFFLNKPVLLVLSPQFARTIMVRDFATFVNRGVYFDRAGDPLSANLFFIEGDEWRGLRSRMTRTFTAGKIRTMYEPLRQVGDELLERMEQLVPRGNGGGGRELELTEVLFRFNTDVIGACAFGIRCRTLHTDNSEFREIGRKMLQFTRFKLFKLYVAMLFRREARALGFRLVDGEVSEFIMRVVREAIDMRKAQHTRQNDFLQIMIDLLAENEEATAAQAATTRLTVEDIAANVFVFFFAGFETSSTVMAYALYELAQNPDIQERARQEIETVLDKHGGQMTFESVAEMTYLEQIVNETMRKHPAVGTLHRVSVEDYVLPNGATMPSGTYVIIPALAFHRDPELFPQPMRFDPDRFSGENRANIHPYSYLPFGEGPRICIGLKFGILQCKLGLAKLLRSYRFGVGAQTRIPLEIDSVSLLHIPKGGVWLQVDAIA